MGLSRGPRCVPRPGFADEADLLTAIEGLAAIPGLEAFELVRELSLKNDYRYEHPQHVAFVEQRWDGEVAAASPTHTAPT